MCKILLKSGCAIYGATGMKPPVFAQAHPDFFLVSKPITEVA